MKSAVAVVFGLFLVANHMSALPASAREPVQLDTASAIEKTDGSLLNHILLDITSRKARAVSKRGSKHNEQLISWLDQLGTYYAQLGNTPLWTDENGFNDAANEVMAEIRKAGDWGLDATAFRFPAIDHVQDSGAGVQDTTSGTARPSIAAAEVAMSLTTLKYAWHANGGRINPTDLSLWLDQNPRAIDALDLLPKLTQSSDKAALLQELHPQHPQFQALRKAYLELRDGNKEAAVEKKKPEDIYIPKGPRLRPGTRHAHIALVRQRLDVPVSDGDPDVYDDDLVDAVYSFMRKRGWRRKTTIDHRVRRALNKARARNGRSKPTGKAAKMRAILVNMEKWRWLPRDLGNFYIWNNLPHFETQVVRNGETVHRERIIIGKTRTQTPVFTGKMSVVVFKPEWGVPPSIKLRTLLPRLRGGDYNVLRRRGMRISINGRTKSPHRVNWAKTDIRSIPIVQGPGPSNPLGRIKFLFPNKHAVYMHDTPKKHLFKTKVRTHSAGCIRVRNPLQFAEVILDETAGWSRENIDHHLAKGADPNNRFELPETFPVYNVYFTMLVEEDGTLVTLKDIYGHDKRIRDALNGKSAKLIARNDPARIQKRENERLAKAQPYYQQQPDPFAFNSGLQPWWQQPSPQAQPWPQPKKYKKYKKRKRSTLNNFQISPFGNGNGF